MKDLLNTTLGRLRVIGFAEGVSLLLLMGIAMPLKYIAGDPTLVKYVGWAHGILFIGFMIAVLAATIEYKWPFKILVQAFLAALLPFGTFIFDARIKKILVRKPLVHST